MMRCIAHVLAYVDGSEPSLTAAQYAICLAHELRARLTAMYVINSDALRDLLRARIFVSEEGDEYAVDLEQDAERYLRHVRDLAHNKGLAIETVTANGVVHREIRRIVSERGIDLLVIGELARIRSRRDAFYDETERAMRGVDCSVLIVKNADRVWELYQQL